MVKNTIYIIEKNFKRDMDRLAEKTKNKGLYTFCKGHLPKENFMLPQFP